MKVLVIGSGGREHALAWKLSKSSKVEKVFVSPGNAGTALEFENVDISPTDIDKLIKFALDNTIDLTVVGPEDPLCKGIVDKFRKENLNIIGPDASSAMLEGSKKFAKEFMIRYGIPTAKYVETNDYEEAVKFLDGFGVPVVIKADGLAAGKGVIIAETVDEAKDALKDILINKKFKDSGEYVVIEEFLRGIEASIICITDGKTILPLSSAKDYKRALDGDKGLNTGGMGAISPNPIITEDLLEKINTKVLKPFLKGVKEENFDYRGILFVGLMIENNDINVLEFNVRFGDPETEVILPRLKNDLIDIFMKIVDRKLDDVKLEWDNRHSCTVVLTSKGYPEAYEKEKVINIDSNLKDSIVFHAGTKILDSKIVTNGGRVLNIVSLSKNLNEAIEKSYNNIKNISFEGITYRKDIGKM